MTIDLKQQSVRAGNIDYSFEIEPEAKQMLLEGLDSIDLTLSQSAAIDEWTAADCKARPWVYLEKTA